MKTFRNPKGVRVTVLIERAKMPDLGEYWWRVSGMTAPGLASDLDEAMRRIHSELDRVTRARARAL